PVVAGTTYNQSTLKSLPGNPWVSSNSGTTGETDTAEITHDQTSVTTFNVTSDVNVSGEYTYSTIGWVILTPRMFLSGPRQILGTV
ncbi:MAG: hypothetical protein WC331_04055, partial [Candidatus Omnitrophota bacterium]